MSQEPKRNDRTNLGSAPAAAHGADNQLVFQQYGFSHNGAHSARAHDFGDGGQQVDGEYEKVTH